MASTVRLPGRVVAPSLGGLRPAGDGEAIRIGGGDIKRASSRFRSRSLISETNREPLPRRVAARLIRLRAA